MGAWGPGLYANDDAEDFVVLIRAVIRLPKPIDELVDLLFEEAEDAMENRAFTVVILADQLEKRGIRHPRTCAEAIRVLETGSDIEILRQADMDTKDLEARRRSNSKILERLKNPRPEKPRKTLTRPQSAVVSAGDYVRFPTQNGGARNPHFPPGREAFEQDGWGLVQIYDAGWEFGYLHWVQLLPLGWAHRHPPGTEDAESARPLGTLAFGTLSPNHFKRMEMEVIGSEPPRLDAAQPGPDERTARFVALNDVSVCNLLVGLS